MALVSKPDIIRILEHVYRVDQPLDAWVLDVLEVVNLTLGLGSGTGAVLYRLRDTGTVDLELLTGVEISDEWRDVGLALHADPSLEHTIHQGYSSWPLCGSFREMLDLSASAATRDQVLNVLSRYDVYDQLLINARESSGVGLALSVFTDHRLQLSTQLRDQLVRVATHLSTAYRLQRRLHAISSLERSPQVEAILDTKGRLAHAEPPAQSARAREQLGEAARLREWAQGRIRHEQPERAVEAWKGLINRRWTLVDHMESDGKRYILARENILAPRRGSTGPLLSQREREVAALAALQRSNKVIAYELGISHSTVRVLIGRACAKLGVRSREELVAKLTAAADSGEPAPNAD